MRKKDNFLEYIPVCSDKITWNVENEKIVIDMYHRDFFSRIVQVFFNKPKISHISLDICGSFVWKQIDGKNTVGDIANLVKYEFGSNAEPLYNRLVQYLCILQNNKFIKLTSHEVNLKK